MSSINILALDTSSNCCSVALQYNGIIKQIFASAIERSEKILIIIEKLLNNIPINEVSALAFAAGPGSLTGLKIASSIIQALHLVYKKPIIKISTLQALALLAMEKFNTELVIPCIDAKMGQIYYGVYKRDVNIPCLIPQAMQPDSLGYPEEILKLSHKALLIGSGTPLLEKQLQLHSNTIEIAPTLIDPNAGAIVKLADYCYKKYGIISNNADPIYLRSYY